MQILSSEAGISAINCGRYNQTIFFSLCEDNLYRHVRGGSVSRRPGWTKDRVISFFNSFNQVEDLPVYSGDNN